LCIEPPVFIFSEHTFAEAAEQTPRPRAGSAQAAGAANDHVTLLTDAVPSMRAGGFVLAGAIGSRATSIRAGR
jgi:hypothetical protein